MIINLKFYNYNNIEINYVCIVTGYILMIYTEYGSSLVNYVPPIDNLLLNFTKDHKGFKVI